MVAAGEQLLQSKTKNSRIPTNIENIVLKGLLKLPSDYYRCPWTFVLRIMRPPTNVKEKIPKGEFIGGGGGSENCTARAQQRAFACLESFARSPAHERNQHRVIGKQLRLFK